MTKDSTLFVSFKSRLIQALRWRVASIKAKTGDQFARHAREIGSERKFNGIKCDVRIGPWSYYQSTCEFRGYNTGDNIIIGKFCSIAQYVNFVVGGNHNFAATTYPFHWLFFDDPKQDIPEHQGDLIVGNDVWIGYGATIVRATIGHGSVIGARSVVRGVIPPYSIIVGNPAQIIKNRFDDEQIKKLLEIAWWDWPIEKIREETHLLTGDISAFLEKHWKPT